MDYLKQAIDKNECLIYSFGLGSDWTFENTMANMGCTIRALGTLPPENYFPSRLFYFINYPNTQQ